jgi:hypothetical protein
MILLALAIVLLLTGSGEADQTIQRGLSPNEYIDAFHAGPIASCDMDYTNCRIFKPERFPCYQRMREAMRAMDAAAFNPDGKSLRSFTNKESDPQVFLTIETERLWKKTMHDCVKETP